MPINTMPQWYAQSCIYWCWCSLPRDFIIPADPLSTSLGMGLSITLKAGGGKPGLLWGTMAQ